MSLLEQAWALGALALTGAGLSFLLDCYHVGAQIARVRGVYLAITDAIYWMITTAVVFSVFLAVSSGELRVSLLFAIFLGFCCYRFTAHAKVLPWLFRGGHGVRKLLFFSFRVLMFLGMSLLVGLQWMGRLFFRPAAWTGRWLRALLRIPSRKKPLAGEEEEQPVP